MRTILTSLAVALALAASSAVAGADCFSNHQQSVQSTAPDETVAMTTFDGANPVAVEDEAAVTETVCADGDANCQTPPAE